MTETVGLTTGTQPDFQRLVRPVVRDASRYVPAKGAAKLPDQHIRLDMNESPYGPSPRTRAALMVFVDTNRYPDFTQRQLRAALADYTGVPATQIICGAGLDDVFTSLANLLIDPGDEVVISEPTFGVYRPLFALHGANVINAPLSNRFELEPESVLAAVTGRTKLIVICSPNNPTGNLFSMESIASICAAVGCLVTIDEAYVEFSGQSHIPLMDRYPNVAILRTMSKWAGLAGMRVGYGMMPQPLVPYLDAAVPPFHNVGLLSAEAAVASLDDREVLMERVAMIRADRDDLHREIAGVSGLEPLPSVTNFILVRTKLDDARPLVARIAERGVLVRGYGDDILRSAFRVTVGRPDENALFLTALRASLEEV